MILEPVSIREIAEAIRDRTWLDARVLERSIIARVQINAIRIDREAEILTLVQEYLDDEADRPGVRAFDVDAEDVMWIRPTECEIEDVPTPRTAGPPLDEHGNVVEGFWTSVVWSHVVLAVADAFGMTQDAFSRELTPPYTARDRDDVILRRYVALGTLYELTPLEVSTCVHTVGWQSSQPWVTLRFKLAPRNGGDDLRRYIVKAMDIVRGRLGSRLPRRARASADSIL